MPDVLAQTLALPGFWWLVLTISAAGIVRGFTGFGTALIFVPVAGLFLPAAHVIATITLTGIASTFALLPRAWRQGDPCEVGLLVLAALPTVPLGLLVMDRLDALTVRWVVAVIAGGTLVALVSGWRYSGKVTLPGLLSIGAAAGMVGGLTGLTGPIVILFYLAGQAVAQSVRANTILFLAALDVVVVANLLLRGFAGWQVLWLAGALAVPYFITTLIGQALFHPGKERLYRNAAFAVIGLAVITGAPVWGKEARHMQMHEISFTEATPIDGYGPGFFRVAGQVIEGAVCVTEKGARSWSGLDDSEALLALAGEIDVIFIGTGAEIAHIPDGLRSALEETGMGVETMNSPAACRTFNVLLSEGRRVAAAVLPV